VVELKVKNLMKTFLSKQLVLS